MLHQVTFNYFLPEIIHKLETVNKKHDGINSIDIIDLDR